MNFLLEALIILTIGFCLLRIAGKKTVAEMTGLEIITLLSVASVVGHAVSENTLIKTILTLCLFIALLITVQFLAVKFDIVEKWFMGKATPVIENGRILHSNLKKLRLTVDQLEGRLREKGITSFAEVKNATIEISGQIGYELYHSAKPVTVGEMEKLLKQLQIKPPKAEPKQNYNLFDEVLHQGHDKLISPELE